MKDVIQKLLMFFNKKEKKRLILLFCMMIIGAAFETIGIGMIVPIVGIITNPNIIHQQEILSYIYSMLHFRSDEAFIVFAVISLLAIFILKNLYLLFFNYVQLRVVSNQQVKLSRKLFKAYLTKPYAFHIERNTANLLRNINSEIPRVFNGIIISGFQLFTELLVTALILILLFMTEPVATLVASLSLCGSVFLFFKVFNKKISQLGKEQQRVGGLMIKWVNQGLGASKEVKVSGKENFFINAYTEQSLISVNNSRYMGMLGQVPRLFIETLLVSIILITMLGIVLNGENTAHLVSTMALFAMATFRIMPSINRIIALCTSIRYSWPALAVVYQDLFQNKDHEYEINLPSITSDIVSTKGKVFTDCIKLVGVSFCYPAQKSPAIKDISLTIPIGRSVAFIGESGAGKTTLVDIILGLFNPEKGQVLVDGKPLHDQRRLWQQKIGYIPQSIYLSDDTIRHNVAFGIDSEAIDDNEVWRALEQAQLKDFVEKLPNQLDTTVGEHGVRLSGGQRQRIGIARALYHNPEILFMDEATSALDNETEKEIMKAIDGLKGEKTLIIIAHRLTTTENCDIVFRLSNGRLIAEEKRLKQSVI
ncbi:ABC transporter ATP-binding protein [Camelliibacillus cellulosilyticus]|uniref:ABC transporter ATP-binding protein n=1 Tax=Camelliibacillus cellulosilyticus TaxID=2174486 RepID=A0ABV9GS69_9BACL